MARAMDAVQAERAGRSSIAPVALVKLTCYSDQPAKTVAKAFYFSNLPVMTYDFGNTGTQQTFWPVIIGGGNLFSGMVHVPQPDDLSPYNQSFNLQLSNLPINGSRLIAQLQTYNLEGASIDIAQMLVPDLDAFPVDLSAYVGDEHTVFFSARVKRVSPITNEMITVQCTTEMPSSAASWIYALDANGAAPRDVGLRVQRPYGSMKRIPLVQWIVGTSGTLIEAIDATENNVDKLVSDASDLPAAFVMLVGLEQINCTKVDNVTIHIETSGRGFNSTTAVAHEASEIFFEFIETATWLIADQPSTAVSAIYRTHPNTGALIRFNPATSPLFVDLGDTITIPGREVTSVKLSSEGSTTQQALSVSGASIGTDEAVRAVDRVGTGFGAESTYANSGSGNDITVTFQDLGTFTEQTIRVQLTNQAGGGDVAIIVNATTVLTIPRASIPANDTDPAEFSVTTSEVSNTITIDPLVSSGIRLHNVERDIDLFTTTLDQVGVTPTTNIAGAVAANLTDGDLGTFVKFDAAAGEYCQVVFDNPGYTYQAQRVRIYAKIVSNHRFEIQVDAVAKHAGSYNISASSPHWYEFECAASGETIKFLAVDSTAKIYIYEIRRTIIATASAEQIELGQSYYADVDGVPVPPPTVETYALGETFDAGTWNASGCAVALDTAEKVEGVGSQKVTIDALASVIDTDAATNWSSADATVSVSTTEGHSEGSGCIKAVSTDGASPVDLTFDDASLALDISDTGGGVGIVLLDVKLKYVVGEPTYVTFGWGNDLSNTHSLIFAGSLFPEDTWVTVALDSVGAAVSGAPSDTDFDYMVITFNGSPNPDVGNEIYIDNVRIVRERTAIIQNNAIGGLDFTEAAESYRIALRGTGSAELLAAVPKVYISDDTGTGTTLTTDYRKIDFPNQVGDSAWASVVSEASDDVNTPDVSSVNTLRLELVIQPPASSVFARSTATDIVWVDRFEFASAISGAWIGVEGALMDHPADILRHWIEVIGGETVDAASYSALGTSLGASAKWAFDARSLGFQWEEVLQRMAFEARCNVVAVEKASGRVWKLLAADSGYGFGAPAASAVITQTHDMADEGRGVDDLASYFTFLYAFDASLPGSGNEEGYRKALIANPDVSNVPITASLIDAAAKRFGAIDSGPISFLCIQDTDTAADVAGYLVQERMANQRRVFRLNQVAWFDALPYDVGDIVSITAPWSSTATTCRITSMEKAFSSNEWTISAVEVLETGTHT